MIAVKGVQNVAHAFGRPASCPVLPGAAERYRDLLDLLSMSHALVHPGHQKSIDRSEKGRQP